MKNAPRDRFNDRLAAAALARKAVIERCGGMPRADDPGLVARRSEIEAARADRAAAKAAEAERKAATLAAEQAARAAVRDAELKAARDARYAARKARQTG